MPSPVRRLLVLVLAAVLLLARRADSFDHLLLLKLSIQGTLNKIEPDSNFASVSGVISVPFGSPVAAGWTTLKDTNDAEGLVCEVEHSFAAFAWHRDTGTIALVFEGTGFNDMFANFWDIVWRNRNFKETKKGFNPMFFDQVELVRDCIEKKWAKIKAAGFHVDYLTGVSMGGAAANIFKAMHPKECEATKLVTFAAPAHRDGVHKKRCAVPGTRYWKADDFVTAAPEGIRHYNTEYPQYVHGPEHAVELKCDPPHDGGGRTSRASSNKPSGCNAGPTYDGKDWESKYKKAMFAKPHFAYGTCAYPDDGYKTQNDAAGIEEKLRAALKKKKRPDDAQKKKRFRW